MRNRLRALFRPCIRPAAAGDGPGCHAVFLAAVHDGARAHYTPEERAAWAPAPMPEGWETRLLSQHTVLAEYRRRPVGFMTLGGDGFLDFAYVHPDWMGRGIADRLYAEILRVAQDSYTPEMTTEASHLAQRFFLRKGWETVARQSVIRNGVALTNFRMRCPCHVSDTGD